jgi:molybdopterin-guanine dinucleotide biosynthesis protein A
MKTPFSALLLAGGRSSRMGEDKALMTYRHHPLWRHQVEKLKSAGATEILISRSRDQSTWESELPFVFDRFEQVGPMGGIIAGMEASRHDLLMVLAVDLPLISLDILEGLKEASTPGCGAIFISDRYFEPLVALYPKILLQEMLLALKSGERSLQRLLKIWVEDGKMRSLQIPSDHWIQWSNVNTPGHFNQVRGTP